MKKVLFILVLLTQITFAAVFNFNSNGNSLSNKLLEEYIDVKLERNQILNINFPKGKLEDCKGIKRGVGTSEDSFFHDRYKMIEEKPDGTRLYMVDGIYNEDAEPDTDFRAIVDGYVSVGVVNNIR